MLEQREFDAVIVGAGAAGLYALHRLRGLGLRAVVFEAGHEVGGTWYWNRYPGARCDVASVEYSFGFSKELEQEWTWTELMATQGEIEEYLNHIADRFDLRRDICFGARVTSASWDDQTDEWRVCTDRGDDVRARYCIMATGCLSLPLKPDIKGIDTFEGVSVQTSLWPREGVDLAGKRVAVIGTGSSGVQSIPEIAKVASQLTVFQRTPTYTWPSNNRALTAEEVEAVKADYDGIRRRQWNAAVAIAGSVSGALMEPPTEKLLDLTVDERQKRLDRYGFAVTRLFADVSTDMEANKAARELYAQMVRRVVSDPETAKALTPSDYPIGCKRPVIDKDYFVTFNRPNVKLVDLRTEPIEAVTKAGIRTSKRDYEFDVIVYATGFDAMTGALLKIDITGLDNLRLADKWAAGPRNYLGLMVAGFPNLFTITGPGSPAVLANMLVGIEHHVNWIADCLAHMRTIGKDIVEPTTGAEEDWVHHVNTVAAGTMLTDASCNSWYVGANVPGKPRQILPYAGGFNVYRRRCDEVVSSGYTGFRFGRRKAAAMA